MYTYHCHDTKHVHVPLSQYKTLTRTNVTIQSMRHVPLGAPNINAFFSVYWPSGIFRRGNLKFAVDIFLI